MGFKRPVVIVTISNQDGLVVEKSLSPVLRWNQHYDRPPQGSRRRKRTKAKLHALRKAKP